MRDDAVSHKDLGLSWATGPQLLLCPQHTLTLHLLGTMISGPGDHQGTFPLETGLCQDPPPRERASRRQPSPEALSTSQASKAHQSQKAEEEATIEDLYG